MKVLVTGAAGQLGRALVATAPVGHEVVALDRAALDLTDERAIADAMVSAAPDLVINAAAYTAVDRAESERDLAFAVNRDAPAALARAAIEAGARFVHVSTDFVFDGRAGSPIALDAPIAPLGVYGASKAAGEAAVMAVGPALIIRTAWVYGAGGKNFVATMLRLAREGKALRVVADQVGTPTHAASLARALWALAAARATGLNHFTDAGAASWYDLAHATVEEGVSLGLLAAAVPVVPIATADYPTPAARPGYSVLDKTATWALLGGPARHWREELRDMLREEKAR